MRRGRYLPATAPQYAYVLTNDGAPNHARTHGRGMERSYDIATQLRWEQCRGVSAGLATPRRRLTSL
jgi:hypothetical protein